MLAKAHKIVSRQTEGQEPANDNPFNCITYNLIDLCDKSAYNGDNWVSYIGYCRGADLSQKKPYRNDTRKPSNRTTNEGICKYKAITKEEN
jgi:hypothetical protein